MKVSLVLLLWWLVWELIKGQKGNRYGGPAGRRRSGGSKRFN